MTQLRATVYRDRIERRWWIDIDDSTRNLAETEALGGTWTSWAGSHPEAMQAAYKMLSDLDKLLMNQGHASRSRRRTYPRLNGARCECGHPLIEHFDDTPTECAIEGCTCMKFALGNLHEMDGAA